jgi:hypothetical protein
MKTLREMIDIVEAHINHDAPEPLVKHFASLYYNGLSSADEAKLAAHIYQQVIDGELSLEQLKQNIATLEKEKGLAEEASPEAIAKIEQLHKN